MTVGERTRLPNRDKTRDCSIITAPRAGVARSSAAAADRPLVLRVRRALIAAPDGQNVTLFDHQITMLAVCPAVV